MGEPELSVSDHALVRFIERVKGISLEQYRDEIKFLAHSHANIDRPIDYDNGFALVIQIVGQPVVVTVLGPGQRPKRDRLFTRMVFVPSERAGIDPL